MIPHATSLGLLVGVVRPGTYFLLRVGDCLIIAGFFVFLGLTNAEVPSRSFRFLCDRARSFFFLSLVVSFFLLQVLQAIARARLARRVERWLGTDEGEQENREITDPRKPTKTCGRATGNLQRKQPRHIVWHRTLQGAGGVTYLFLGSGHVLHWVGGLSQVGIWCNAREQTAETPPRPILIFFFRTRP